MRRRDFLELMGGMGGSLVLGDIALGNIAQGAVGSAKTAYPVNKINYLVGYPPGGGNDLMARGIGLYITKHLKSASPSPDRVGVVIKNVPAGSGLKYLNDIYHAKPDGYTIAHSDDILHTRSVLGELGFDPFELTFIARVASNTKVLLTGAKSNIHTWADVVKAAKAAPLRIGCAAFGTSNHVATLLLIDATKLDAKTVFFGGTPNVNAALIRRDIPLALNNEDSVRDLINAKELRPVLSFSEKSTYPDIQSVREIGHPELVEPLKPQRYFIGPPRLPAEIKATLENALKKTMVDKEFVEWSGKAGLGFNPVYGAEMNALVKNVQGFYKSKERMLREALKS